MINFLGKAKLQNALAQAEAWDATLALLRGDLREAEQRSALAVSLAGHAPNFSDGHLAQMFSVRLAENRSIELLPGLRLVDPGNTVFAGSGSTLIVITQIQPITVVFNVSEDDLPRVQEQLNGKNKLSVDIFDRANEQHLEAGTLTSLDNQVDTTTGTVRFRAEFANKDLGLFPNQFVIARLLVNTR